MYYGENLKFYRNRQMPVWANSSQRNMKFIPLPKRTAVGIWHKARAFERRTRQPGKQDGKIGRNGILILQALLFDFLNFASGRLDPSYAAIAAKAGISVRSVARGLVKLREAGVLNWMRRCVQQVIDGRFTLCQVSNAYAVLPSSQWRGWVEPPPPDAIAWGATPPLACGLDAAAAAIRSGEGQQFTLRLLETSDPDDPLAQSVARLWRLRDRGTNH